MTTEQKARYRNERAKGHCVRSAYSAATYTPTEPDYDLSELAYSDEAEFVIERDGRTLTIRVDVKRDDYQDAPWDNQDGIGDWSEAGGRYEREDHARAPYIYYRGDERHMRGDMTNLYEEQRDWYHKTGSSKSVAADRARADVEKTVDFVNGWLEDDWTYMVVTARVFETCTCCDSESEIGIASLGGVESIDTAYVQESASEVVSEAIFDVFAAKHS